jgi:hypothetical protein
MPAAMAAAWYRACLEKNSSSRVKARLNSGAFTARLKPCPFNTTTLSAACEAVPFHDDFNAARLNSLVKNSAWPFGRKARG